MLTVDFCNAISIKICLICKEHCCDKNGLAVCLTIDKQKIAPVDYQQELELAHVQILMVQQLLT
jgi:hypothetical protein